MDKPTEEIINHLNHLGYNGEPISKKGSMAIDKAIDGLRELDSLRDEFLLTRDILIATQKHLSDMSRKYLGLLNNDSFGPGAIKHVKDNPDAI